MSFCLNKQVEAELRSIAGNNICCDCEDKNPQWASVSFGVFMCLECSGRHRALGVHISFVRSVSMDSWTEKQINMMRQGGNKQFNDFLAQYSVKKAMAIPQKYATPASMLYKDRLSAKVEGRELPTQLPVVASNPSSSVYEGTDPLPGESETDYVARQKLLQEKARERMRAKFGTSNGLSGKMGGVGSDPNYNPNKTGSSSDVINGALGFLGSAVGNVTSQVQSGEGWNMMKSGVTDLWSKASSVVADITKPEDEPGNIFGITKEKLKGGGGGGATGPPSRESSMSRADSGGSIGSNRASPTFRSSTPSPTNSGASDQDLAAIAAIKNMNLDNSSVSRNSSSGSLSGSDRALSRNSSGGFASKDKKVATALAPSGDDFFASFNSK